MFVCLINMVPLVTIAVVILVFMVTPCHGNEYFENLCGKTLDIGKSGGVMYSGEVWFYSYYSSNLTCTVTLQTTADRKILLTWDSFNVEYLDDVLGTCVDTLKIYDGSIQGLGLNTINSGKECGLFLEYPNYVPTGNIMTLKLVTNAADNNNDFKFVYTSVKTKDPCDKDEFKCKNGYCIDDELADTFNFDDNCGDGSDLEALDEWVNGLLRWGLGVLIAIIVGIIVAGLLICICCGCLCYHLCCKNQRSSNQTTVVHAPPPGHAPPPAPHDGMQMHGYSNGGYGNKI